MRRKRRAGAGGAHTMEPQSFRDVGVRRRQPDVSLRDDSPVSPARRPRNPVPFLELRCCQAEPRYAAVGGRAQFTGGSGKMSFLSDFWSKLVEQFKHQQQNVEQAEKTFGSGGAKFAELKGSKDMNPRQTKLFDEKLKQAIAKDPRAVKGAMKEGDLKKLAQKAADVTTKLATTPLSKDVNKMSQKSATLKDNIVKLQNDGWTIKKGIAGKGSFADRSTKTITIDPSEGTKDIVVGLAHETGHADYTKPADPSVEDDSPSIAKGKEYIRKVVENCLLDEGQAQIVACKTAKELEAAGETGISIPGANSDKYKEIYEKIEAGTLTMDQGRKEMAKVMATETTSNSSENYIDYYSKDPREDWNAAHPDAEVPETPRIAVFP